MDFFGIRATVEEISVNLTHREFILLKFLIGNKDHVFTRLRTIDRQWSSVELGQNRTVDVHVGHLRTKLGIAGPSIVTVFGIGYCFVDEPVNSQVLSESVSE